MTDPTDLTSEGLRLLDRYDPTDFLGHIAAAGEFAKWAKVHLRPILEAVAAPTGPSEPLLDWLCDFYDEHHITGFGGSVTHGLMLLMNELNVDSIIVARDRFDCPNCDENGQVNNDTVDTSGQVIKTAKVGCARCRGSRRAPGPIHFAPSTTSPAAPTEPTTCTGDDACSASPHTHGCYADRGDCDNPADHGGVSVATPNAPRYFVEAVERMVAADPSLAGCHRFVYMDLATGKRTTCFIGEGSVVRSYVTAPYLLAKDMRTGAESDDPWGVIAGRAFLARGEA